MSMIYIVYNGEEPPVLEVLDAKGEALTVSEWEPDGDQRWRLPVTMETLAAREPPPMVSDATGGGPINAGEPDFEVTDAGSDAGPVTPPSGVRWIDVQMNVRLEVAGEADTDMVANAAHHELTLMLSNGGWTFAVASGSPFESVASCVEIVKVGGLEQGLS